MSSKISTLDRSSIITMLGGENKGRCACPICKARHSVAVDVGKSGKVLIHCFSNECDVWGWIKGSTKGKVVFVDNATTDKIGAEDRWRRAFSVLRLAVKANAGQPDKYLKARGINIVPPNAMLLPAHLTAKIKGIGKHFPAMVLPIRNAEGICGAQVTMLTRSMDARLPENAKFTLGFTKGGYVPLAEIKPDEPLVVAEGIETALSAMQLTGFPGIATLGTSGMKSLQVPKCSKVIIASDRGAPGQDAAKALGKRIAGRVPTYNAAAQEKDWNDELRLALSKPKLLEKLKDELLHGRRIKPPKFTAKTMAEFSDLTVLKKDFLLDPLLISGHSTMLSAPPGAGKTRLSLSMAYAIATGDPLMHWTPPKPERVLYVDAELPAADMQAWIARLGPPTDNLAILSDAANMDEGQPEVKLATEEQRQFVWEEIQQFDPKFVVLDALMTLCPANMVEGKLREDHWSEVEQWIDRLKRQGRHVLLLHHDNKAGTPYGSMLKHIRFDLMTSLEPLQAYSKDGRYAFRISFSKPRHLKQQDSRPQMLSVNDEGIIQWEQSEAPAHIGRPAEHDDKIAEMHYEGLSTRKIAEALEISAEGVRKALKRLGLWKAN